MDRSATLSTGELQRLRLASQVREGLFGVVILMNHRGLHPQKTHALPAV